jgi:UDPglucose--hexose-1-phosphate uridylyltransferase
LIALPIVPEAVSEEIAGCKKHYEKKQQCIYCDLIKQELKDGRRIVCQNEHFITLVPYAPRFPFEMWILPRTHSARFEQCETRLLDALASLLKESLLRMRSVLKAPPYNFVFHTAPVNGNHYNYYHWHIEIMPKLTKMAGFEQGTGFYINPTVPEDDAKILREVLIEDK